MGQGQSCDMKSQVRVHLFVNAEDYVHVRIVPWATYNMCATMVHRELDTPNLQPIQHKPKLDPPKDPTAVSDVYVHIHCDKVETESKSDGRPDRKLRCTPNGQLVIEDIKEQETIVASLVTLVPKTLEQLLKERQEMDQESATLLSSSITT